MQCHTHRCVLIVSRVGTSELTFTNEGEPILFQTTLEVKTSSCFKLIEVSGNGLFQKKSKQGEGGWGNGISRGVEEIACGISRG